MSHQTVHAITQSVAEKISQSSLSESQDLKKPKVLYIEGDGVFIGSQEKHKHLEFKRGFIHEGIDRQGKRGRLLHPVYFGTFGTSQDLFAMISDYLTKHYDLKETLIIANSDGGSGYDSSQFESVLGRYSHYEYCLDAYHVMRQITGKLGFDKSLQAGIRKAVKTYHFDEVTVLLDTAESQLEDEKQLESLISLRAYLERYWEAIKPLSERGLSVPSGVGVCESGHRYYTNRMKRQGRNWLKRGAENMATLLTAVRNGNFKTRYREIYQEVNFRPEVEISMRKILKQAKHRPHTIPQARIALNGATSTPIGQLKKWI